MSDKQVYRLLLIGIVGVSLLLIGISILFYGLLEERNRLEDEVSLLQGNIKYIGPAETHRQPPEWFPKLFSFPLLTDDFMLTSPIGRRVSPILSVGGLDDHNGLDISAAWRARVVPAAPGVVLIHWPPPDSYYRGHDIFGGYIVIQHANGFKTEYGHLSETYVNTGDAVNVTDVIGRVGSTGLSTGPHLHFAIESRTGIHVNPEIWMEMPNED